MPVPDFKGASDPAFRREICGLFGRVVNGDGRTATFRERYRFGRKKNVRRLLCRHQITIREDVGSQPIKFDRRVIRCEGHGAGVATC